MTDILPADRLARRITAHRSAHDADEVRVRVTDSVTSAYRTGYDGAVSRRGGTHRTVVVSVRTGSHWSTELSDGAAPPLPHPPPTDAAGRVSACLLDPATGRPCPEVVDAEYAETSSEVTVLDAGGLTRWDHTHRRLRHWVGGAGGQHLEGAVTWGDRLPDPLVPREERLGLLAVRDAGPGPRGTMPVLLRPAVALHLVNLLASMVNGTNVLGGMRALRERVGRRIAAPAVTVVDDGRLDGPYGSLVDDEGVPTARNVLLESGVLRGFLHSRATAAAFGCPPNGCAVRSQPDGPIGPAVRGFALLPRGGGGAGASGGSDGVDELRALLGTGLEAVAVCRPAVRTDGGRKIRLELFGWHVRAGERDRPVGPVTLEVGLFGWLRTVAACGPTLHHSAVFRGLAAPAVLLSEGSVG
ncbi:hypothetical protein H8N00_15310 [Streptomyces sp. AC563]|uniref:metallopeptidase TldD-related protein n=1 Tax=Streptomyces buecherae TaxID=2763006 RepID=UPI00164D2AF8|nr:metallopeptidase TldD-related protein [Streptomyces buecherae]MBC3990225.1 hypothetical protein [Streptomyces buecherae]